jgi:hypothetical protein
MAQPPSDRPSVSSVKPPAWDGSRLDDTLRAFLREIFDQKLNNIIMALRTAPRIGKSSDLKIEKKYNTIELYVQNVGQSQERPPTLGEVLDKDRF